MARTPPLARDVLDDVKPSALEWCASPARRLWRL